jgi:hypothetical protein
MALTREEKKFLTAQYKEAIERIHQEITPYKLPGNYNYAPLVDMAIRRALEYENLLDHGVEILLTLAQEQAFHDGNKRTALMTGLVFAFEYYGTPKGTGLWKLIREYLFNEESKIVKFMLETAQGRKTHDEIKQFLSELAQSI